MLVDKCKRCRKYKAGGEFSGHYGFCTECTRVIEALDMETRRCARIVMHLGAHIIDDKPVGEEMLRWLFDQAIRDIEQGGRRDAD